MTVTNESGGRLNAFANEPKIEVITSENSTLGISGLLKLTLAFSIMSIIGIFLFGK